MTGGPRRASDIEPVAGLRTGLLALTVLSILATAVELASERHWNSFAQIVPWLALAVLVVAVVAFVVPGSRGLLIARLLAVVVLAASAYGVVDHVLVNYAAGELDQRYSAVWDDLPWFRQWWYAITKTVGPSPTLAPGVLGQAGLLLLLAGLGRDRRRDGAVRDPGAGRPSV